MRYLNETILPKQELIMIFFLILILFFFKEINFEFHGQKLFKRVVFPILIIIKKNCVTQ